VAYCTRQKGGVDHEAIHSCENHTQASAAHVPYSSPQARSDSDGVILKYLRPVQQSHQMIGMASRCCLIS